ncbi:MAG: hypothetical protein FE048_05160 [Thermoplasmata archaeon]|nr:MAG: hypothetical protein FE048_05160 [Thermoplasmata archaeon]
MLRNEENSHEENVLFSRVESEFNLLERHIKMLKIIMDEGPIGIIKLSEKTRFPQHKVRYSLRVLEEEGLIRPSPRGAIVTDKTYEFIIWFKNLLHGLEERIKEIKKSL